jgi:hypothetical protein
MELSPADVRLKSIGNIGLFETDEKDDSTLTDVLRERQPPLLLLINRDAGLLAASVLFALRNGKGERGEISAASVKVAVGVRAYLKSIRAELGAKTRTAVVSSVHDLQAEGFSGGS